MTPVATDDALRLRVLLLLATARDAELTSELLAKEGIVAEICAGGMQLADALARGAGAVLVAEEMLGPGGGKEVLIQSLERQPRWSDLPVLLFTKGGADSLAVGDAVAALGNVTLLERPLRVAALVSTVRTALRARRRQYEIEDQLRQLQQVRLAEATAARRKDEFLAMLGHELRNPLAPVRNALYVLSLDDSDPQRRAELRTMMERQVNHMVRLVDDLLEASRLSRGMITLHREPLDLRQAVQAGLEQSRPLIEAGGHQVRMDLPDAPLPIDADPVRIAQVFGNLLNNAAKYGNPGGRIVVTARCDGDWACVSVEDDGTGIAAEDLAHVFDLFVQGPQDNEATQEGMGIGLALVRNLLELHGGEVTAHSDGRGAGARFDVRLPLANVTHVSAAATQKPSTLTDMRVLVVDDNVDSATSMAMVVDLLGAKRQVAHDGGRRWVKRTCA